MRSGMDVLMLLVLTYTAVSLLAVVTTYYDAVREYGDLPASQVVLFLREGFAIAMEFMWWLYLFRALGLLKLQYASAVEPPPLTTVEGVALTLLAVIFAVTILVFYVMGRLWLAATAAAAGLLLVNYLDVQLLSLLLGIFLALALFGYAVFKSELRSPPG